MYRVGEGYDVHKLVSGRELILGGVKINYDKGLLGHSDADFLLHAIMDSLLGAMSLGDNTSNVSKVNIERSEASIKLEQYLKSDSELMAMMEKSINKAYAINPNRDTNPVSNVKELYDFIDFNVKALLLKF